MPQEPLEKDTIALLQGCANSVPLGAFLEVLQAGS